MNILVVAHYQNDGSPTAIFVHDQVKAYRALGHHVRVLSPIPFGKTGFGSIGRFQGREEKIGGVPHDYLRYLSLSSWGKDWFNTPSAITALRLRIPNVLDGFRPDVIHAHTLGLDSEIGAWLKERLGCPLVVTTHGSDTSVPYESGKRELLRRYADRADTVVGVSSKLTAKLRDCGTSTPLQSILNGFALEHMGVGTEKAENTWIQVGNLIPQKKADVTIRAFSAIWQKYQGTRLTIVGQGPELPALERLCGELELMNAVHFTGQLPNREVLAQMTKARFFIMPSVQEGFGIVYLEAMASGCVTIGTEGEGIADLIVSGENGFLVPPDNADAIVDVVEWCLAHPEEAAAIAERGRKAALELTWEKNAAQYITLFQTLLER